MKYFLCIVLLITTLLYSGTATHAQRNRNRKPQDNELKGLQEREAEAAFTDGMKYFILEDYAKALGAFQRVAEIRPNEPMVHYKMAEIYTKGRGSDDLNRAALSIETALRLDKKNKYFYLLAARIDSARGNFSRASEWMETLTRDVDPGGDHLFELANFYLYDRKPDEAIRAYNRAEVLMGVNEVSSMQKQRIYLELGKTDQAIMEGEKLMAAFPDEERYVVAISENLALKKQTKAAIEYLEKFIAGHSESGASKVLLAGLYRDEGREKESRDLTRQAIADPSVDLSSKLIILQTYTAQIGFNLARNQADTDMGDFAVALYDELKKRHPDEPNVYIVGGNLYISLRRKAEAEAAFLSAIQHGSASFDAWQNLLALEAEGGRYDSLIFHSEQAMEIFPNQAMVYYFNGYGQLRKRNYREAASSLERGKKLSASNPDLLHDINGMLGDAYNGAKEYIKSDQAFDDALKYKPNDAFILNNYSYYLALRKEHLEKAEHMSAQVIKDFPDNATYLDTHAWVLYTRDKFKEARKTMEHALTLPGVTSVHYEHYGDILFQLGDVEMAVKQWEKARSMTTEHEVLDKKIANRRLY